MKNELNQIVIEMQEGKSDIVVQHEKTREAVTCYFTFNDGNTTADFNYYIKVHYANFN